MLTQSDMPEGYELISATDTFVAIKDAVIAELGIRADLEDKGELWFSVRAETEIDRERSFVSGSKLLELVMLHFGNDILKIVGFWTKETNFKEFIRYVGLGFSEEQAASKVWTGIQAERYGFERVERVTVTYKDGSIKMVKAEFVKE